MAGARRESPAIAFRRGCGTRLIRLPAIADLPDLNVWLALASPTHQHHSTGVKYWEMQASQQVLFCKVTALVEKFVQQPGGSDAQPSSDGWDVFHLLMRQGDLSSRLCTDAHLAALAITNQWRLVSFDRDFHAFAGLNLLQLR